MLILPPELVMDILSRLPAKSLGQSKCVCRSLRSLISNPKFVKMHLNRVSSDTNTNHFRLFTLYPFYSLDFESPSSFEEGEDADHFKGSHEGVDALVNLGYPYIEEYSGEVLGSCNGLVCFLFWPEIFILWNPTTRETKEVKGSECLSTDDVCLYGFGYDSFTDDYKLLKEKPSTDSGGVSYDIFSLKENKWRRIQEVVGNGITVTQRRGTYVNGVLHWEGCRPNKEFVIVSFDMIEEKFWEIMQPEICDTRTIISQNLGVSEGCLTMLSNEVKSNSQGELVVWIMKEYGLRDSWSRLVVIEWIDILFCDYFTPVWFFKNGEIVIDVDGEYILRYNPHDKTTRKLKNQCDQWFEWAVYVESLVGLS